MKNFLAEINERARSPFIYSFLIAWLIFNWKIPISLFFEDVKELETHGYHSHLQFIQAKLNWNNGLVQPVLSALVYTFIFPFIKNGISIFSGWIQSWGNSYTLKASRKGKISVEKYIELKDEYAKQLLLLEEAVDKESVFFKENIDLKEQIKMLKLQYELDDESKNKKILDGFWKFEYNDQSNRNEHSGYLKFQNGDVFKSDISKTNDNKIISRVVLFHFMKSNNSLIMLIKPTNFVRSINEVIMYNQTTFLELNISPEKTKMTGKFGPQLEYNITFTKFE